MSCNWMTKNSRWPERDCKHNLSEAVSTFMSNRLYSKAFIFFLSHGSLVRALVNGGLVFGYRLSTVSWTWAHFSQPDTACTCCGLHGFSLDFQFQAMFFLNSGANDYGRYCRFCLIISLQTGGSLRITATHSRHWSTEHPIVFWGTALHFSAHLRWTGYSKAVGVLGYTNLKLTSFPHHNQTL